MRTPAFGCTSEAHPLYGVFISQLSGCIFEFDERDYNRLLAVKKGQLKASGVKSPSGYAVRNSLNKTELTTHCKRQTRGTGDIIRRIESLILSFTGCSDTLEG